MNALLNGGGIDGYPVKLFVNGKYAGIYTFNIPRDKWLFDMDKTGRKAIVLDNGVTYLIGFDSEIPDYLTKIEKNLYAFRLGTDYDHLEQIKEFVRKNSAKLDAEFAAL